MTESDVLDGLLDREGGFVDDPADAGGATNYGITAETLGNFRALRRPATADEVRQLSSTEARIIYTQRYIIQPGFSPEAVPHEPLRIQLIDFGVNSGPPRAIRWLQRVLRVPVTGSLDLPTQRALLASKDCGSLYLVNEALVAARCYMIDRFVDEDPSQWKFEEGLESRALGFFLSVPKE